MTISGHALHISRPAGLPQTVTASSGDAESSQRIVTVSVLNVLIMTDPLANTRRALAPSGHLDNSEKTNNIKNQTFTCQPDQQKYLPLIFKADQVGKQ